MYVNCLKLIVCSNGMMKFSLCKLYYNLKNIGR